MKIRVKLFNMQSWDKVTLIKEWKHRKVPKIGWRVLKVEVK